ncbi:Galactose binding lectin domain-containing protein [Salegentibacter echinorum]|uniref:Galactose binding lectin domain-containing protein n=1 Tax=Salegentibacter echinorum TaxID=1073325 RepID=A0A1M5CJD3_SALEC|nr:SUEL-type lectin domain-containing protein [Salegentibacter echinorum]SHF54843.1 Galactose binding lectin domain-containing protein [Salegentibacter echinorum]
MEKNYLFSSKFFKSGLFLVVFLFFGFYANAQRIFDVEHNLTSICTGEVLDFQFGVKNGGGGTYGFDTETVYKVEVVYTFRQNNTMYYTPVSSFIFTNKQGPPKRAFEERIINHSISLESDISSRDNYQLLITASNPQIPARPEGISPQTFQIIANNNQIYTETETGTNSWVGHFYDGKDFNDYMGGYEETLIFNQEFGGGENNFQIGNNNCSPSIYTETFSVRYKMQSSFKGLYTINIGSDDGSRLMIDEEWVYNDWNDHAYREENILINLSGNSNLVLEYYENSGLNRIKVAQPQLLIKNELNSNTSQTISAGNTPKTIGGDEFTNLPSGISKVDTGYQWVYSETKGGATTIIPNAKQADFTPNKNQRPFNKKGVYYIYRIAKLKSNNNGLGNPFETSISSNPATVKVQEPLEIINHPQDLAICSDNVANFEVNAKGENLTYQWQRNSGGNGGFYDVDESNSYINTKTPNLQVSAKTWMNGISFRVEVKDSNGNSVYSNPAKLYVNESPRGIDTHPSDQIVCEAFDVSFQTYTSNDERRWQVSEDNGTTWSDLSTSQYYPDVTSERLNILDAPASFNDNLYRIKVFNTSCAVYSDSAKLTVYADPIVQQPEDTTAPFGEDAFVKAGVTGNNLSYQWQTYSSNWYDIDNGEHYGGVNTTRLRLKTVGYYPKYGSKYRLVVINENGCEATSKVAYLRENLDDCNKPTVSLSAPTTICAGEINITGNFTGTAPYTIKAEVNGQVQNLQIPTDNFDYPLNIQQNTSIKILSITDGKNCINNSPVASLDINVISGIGENNITGNQQGCGSIKPALLEGNELGVGYKYTWEKSTSGSSSGFVTASGTSNQATYQPETLTETTWYRRKVEVENCEKDFSNVIKITVGNNLNNNHISFSNRNSGTISRTADEHHDLNISAPANTVFTSVNFASYGTPNIENGKYVKSSCHATTSQNITEDYLLGENSAVIPAENAVFTDPCVGTLKRLYVKASYAEPLCIGAQSPQIQGSNMGDNITYLWEMSFQGPNAGFSPAPGNNSSQNYNPGALEQTTWFKRKATSGTCISESPVLLIPVVKENVWTGTADVNWNNTANWSCNSLPTLKTNVLIPENLSSGNYPVINSGANALAKNLKIENNASLKVKNNWLRISGILKNSGILNAIAGSVSFESNTAQVIPNNAFANNRIRNLRIDNAAGVTSEAIIELTGTLKVETGNFDTGNELTLISNENQTALIDGAGNGEVNGLVSMQRYLDKAFGYKYFSSPFKNSTVGDFSPYLDLNDANTSFPHFYRYNENRNIEIDGVIKDATGWTSYTNTNNPLNIAEGYALNFGTSANPVTIEITGEVNNGITEKNLLNHHGTYTKGFHLIGNPYPSPIDWNAATGWTRSNIDDAIYFFNASENDQYTGSYTSYVNDVSTNNIGANPSPNIIPSMQGFFVKVSDSENEKIVTGTLGMNNEVRVTDFNQQFFRSGLRDLKPLIRLNAKFKAENKEDAMVIYFSPYASTNFEKKMDAHKLMNTDPETPNFYNLTEDKKELAINAIPFPSSGSYKKIPVGLKAEKSGAMIIELNALENLSPNFNIYLIDHKKSIGQNLSKNPVYQFNVNAGTHNSRFELMFSEENVTNPAVAFNEAFHVEARGNDIIVKLNLEKNQEGVLQASTITGQILQVKNAKGKEEVTFKGITSDGVYIINLLVGKAQYAKKVLIKN